MSKIWHPCCDDYGRPVPIHKPSVATNLEHIANAEQIITFVPGCPVPDALNGIAFRAWKDAPTTRDRWVSVPGQMALIEPAIVLIGRKEAGAGTIIEEPDGRIWTVSPTNGFGGYQQTFPKGKAGEGLPLQAVAIKECFEETGLQVEITGLLGDFERSTSFTRYYRARRIGGTPADVGWESQAVHLVPREKLTALLNASADHKIIATLLATLMPQRHSVIG